MVTQKAATRFGRTPNRMGLLVAISKNMKRFQMFGIFEEGRKSPPSDFGNLNTPLVDLRCNPPELLVGFSANSEAAMYISYSQVTLQTPRVSCGCCKNIMWKTVFNLQGSGG